MFIENITTRKTIIIHIFGINISLKTHIKYYFWKLLGVFIDFCFFLKRINLNKDYKIISLGLYCFSRVITTTNKLKPRRRKGEKSCPFDLVFSDFDKNVDLINNNFENFFEGLEKNSDGHWFNPKIKMLYFHDDNLSKNEFIKRYKTRIKNLYEYFSDKSKHKFILLTTDQHINQEQITNLQNGLEKYMNKNEFDIILINKSENICNYNDDNVHIINQHKNLKQWKYISENDWVYSIKKRYFPEALKIYTEITNSMINIIKEVMRNKNK